MSPDLTAPPTLHLLVRRHGGGTETNVHRLVAAVEGFEVAALEDHMGFPLRWSRLPATIAALRARRPRVVFCYGATAHAVAAMAWPVGMPLVGNIRCESDFDGVKGLVRSVGGWRFSAWVSNSRAALRGGRGIVIYNGIDDPPADELPLLPGLPRPVMGMLARGHAKKRHDFALDLWQGLGRPGSLVFAGDLPDALRARALAAGVHCPGFVAPGPLVRSLDMLLVPSDAEGIPTAMLEAMIRGVPCLATPVGGIPEIIRHGRTGYVMQRPGWRGFLESADWRAIAATGRRGQRMVQRRFTFASMAARFAAVARRAGKGM